MTSLTRGWRSDNCADSAAIARVNAAPRRAHARAALTRAIACRIMSDRKRQHTGSIANGTVRTIAVKTARIWVRYQRDSALTQWYLARFANGGPRARKTAIVALVRRVLIDVWRHLDAGVVPAGAAFRIGRARAPTQSRAYVDGRRVFPEWIRDVDLELK
jgi:hypothetical protein